MPTRSRQVRDAAGRPPTANDLARREQITNAAIEIIGSGGWAACTLQSVADRLGVTKAAVVYHVGNKDELVRQAYHAVITGFAVYVHQRVEAATDGIDAIVSFGSAHLDYMREHRDHARVIVETLDPEHSTGIKDSPQDRQRAAPLIAMIEAARDDRDAADRSGPDAAVLAVAIAGIIDAAVAAWLEDADFDLTAADRLLAEFIRRAV